MFELARENPWLSRAVLFVLAAAALTALGLGGTAAGDLVAPLFGPLDPAAEAGFGRNLLVGVMLAGALLANLEFLRLLLFRWPVLVVWGARLLLFYAFLLCFDRDFGVFMDVVPPAGSNSLFPSNI